MADRPPAEFEVVIEALDAYGDGVARAGRLELRVPFSLPGERVRVTASDRRRHPARARLTAVVRPSPHRVTPACRHFGPHAESPVGPCGGCSWQHIAYPEQLRLKSALVSRLLHPVWDAAPDVQPTLAATPLAAPFGVRNTVHFVFGRDGRRLVMGHFARGSRRVVPVYECPVHDPRGNMLAFTFADAFGRARLGSAASGDGVLRGISVRASLAGDERLATLVVQADSDRRLRQATRQAIAQAGPSASLHLNLHPRDNGLVFGEHTRRLAGAARLREAVDGVSFVVSPTAFFQTNVRAAALLVQLVRAAVPAGATVLDLYAGAGLFAIPLAVDGHRVVAVEENRAAVADGEASLRLNRAADGRCRFVASDVRTVLRRGATADVVVLDPPRDGCAPEVLDALFGGVRPALAVYVSCDPTSLARDLAAAARFGYRPVTIQPVDMFPHTPHIETVVVLRR